MSWLKFAQSRKVLTTVEHPTIVPVASSTVGDLRFFIQSQISNRQLCDRWMGKAGALPILLIIMTTYLDRFHESLTIAILELLLTADSVYRDSGSGYNLEYLLS